VGILLGCICANAPLVQPKNNPLLYLTMENEIRLSNKYITSDNGKLGDWERYSWLKAYGLLVLMGVGSTFDCLLFHWNGCGFS